ncbi:MAG TPA: LTA synthase family protein [Prolixibacteraceae bacterium]|nr:LTA synthase family protein [Prolixibacteraceae bacterium]
MYSREKNESNLYPFFNFKDEKPNIVLIIMESLGSRYSGLHAELGSFTPFLDSLASISLYWPHALCTSERTINVLPSVLGSLPYSKDGFTFVSDSCLHLSMISLLIKNGYTSSFFYGGGIQFDKMYNFLRDQGIQTINGHDFYKSADGTVFWGINDQELYKEGISTISKIEAAPRVDIFLTLSTHGPWDYPDIPKFEAKADQLFKKYNSPKEMVDNAMIRSELSSIIFADSTLKELFLQYKKRKDFENTIFIITGDHEFAQTVPKNRFDLYQVPLIIYSPLLKGPKEFKPIVSHLDITPSVLNLLDKKYSLTRPDYEHWLGKDLDTCHIFRSDRKLGFLCLDREINDYLYNDVLLLNNDIFKVNPDLSITLMDMPEEKQQMVKRLDYFRCMNRYTTLNKIVSEEIYCKSFK